MPLKYTYQYPTNGTAKFENFPACLAENPTLEIGEVGGTSGWYIGLDVINNGSSFRAYIRNRFENGNSRVQASLLLLTVPNRHNARFGTSGTHVVKKYDKVIGRVMGIEEAEYGGWLHGNSLWIGYGIHVEAVKYVDDDVWKFNFNDPIFDAQNIPMITFLDKETNEKLYCAKQLIENHSPFFEEKSVVTENVNKFYMEKCLQIAHGDRSHIPEEDIQMTLSTGINFKMLNVIRFCERQMIWMGSVNHENIQLAMKNNLNQYLGQMIKKLDSPKILAGILKNIDLEVASSESMKICAKYLFENMNY
ncbi:unnamed protein product [Caenorhabditis brenneri]